MPDLKPSLSKAIVPSLFVISALLVSALLAACDTSAPTPISTPIPETPTTASAPLSGGQAVFMRYCAVCHPGGHRAAGPDIIGEIASSSDDRLRAVVRTGKNRMPPYNQATISDVQLTDLIAYLHTLK